MKPPPTMPPPGLTTAVEVEIDSLFEPFDPDPGPDHGDRGLAGVKTEA